MHFVPDTPLGVLIWLSRYGRYVEFQQLGPRSRHKNQVMLKYCAPGSTQIEGIGGITLEGAVMKAAMRIEGDIAAMRKAS